MAQMLLECKQGLMSGKSSLRNLILIADSHHKEKEMSSKRIRVTGVFQISPECGIGACPAIFQIGQEGKVENEMSLIIIGSVPTEDELQAVSLKVSPGEVAVRIPKSLIIGLKL